MSLYSPTEFEELDEEQFAAGRGPVPPDRVNRRKVVQRAPKRSRRSRTTEMAKRGMHQRRNKRLAW